jgi:predicted TIM-barrel fold metal-dependent hydrolase
MPLTRREALAVAAGVFVTGRASGKASQPSTPVNFKVPPGACDCHTHIFGDRAKFPFIAGRTYTPEQSLPEEMAAMHRALHVERVVIVTPSVYGTDNSATLYGMKTRGKTARGVAVIGEQTTEKELDAMAQGGVRGIRINLATAGPTDPAIARTRLRAAFERIKNRDWHVQIYATLPLIAALKDLIFDAPVPVVIDHFGGAQASLGLNQPGFSDLAYLVQAFRVYVKISAAYRVSTKGPEYTDIEPLARVLIGANAKRILWGTDWPHPDTTPPRGGTAMDVSTMLQIDDGRLLNQLPKWSPNAEVTKMILVDNPARLYGF